MRPDGHRYELVKGVLRTMTPAGSRHGTITTRLAASLFGHVETRELGVGAVGNGSDIKSWNHAPVV